MDVVYRKATCKDAQGIYFVEKECFSYPWSMESIQYDICQNENAVYIIAVLSNQIVGFCGLHIIFDEGHIMNVAVLMQYRGNGIGEGLLHNMVASTNQTINEYTLEVRVSNKTAIRLYTKLGFESVGIRPNYYPDTGEGALIMWTNKNTP